MAFQKKRMFTEGELDFMKILWDKGEAKPEEIRQELNKIGRPVNFGTIRNILIVMIEKGYVKRKRKGKAYLYRAIIEEEKAKKNMAQHLLKRLFGGSESLLMGALLKNRDVSRKELDEIERLIAEQKKSSKK